MRLLLITTCKYSCTATLSGGDVATANYLPCTLLAVPSSVPWLVLHFCALGLQAGLSAAAVTARRQKPTTYMDMGIFSEHITNSMFQHGSI